jgi:uncharacterized protein
MSQHGFGIRCVLSTHPLPTAYCILPTTDGGILGAVSMARAFLMISLLAVASGAQVVATAVKLAQAAEAQVGVTTEYDPAYRKLAYPGGDVPRDRGVCTDVVIRAFRTIGMDLQKAVHEDMRANFKRYPQSWGLRGPDRNIDHRRVPNLMMFFKRKGKSVPLNGPYQVGDVVAWRLPGGLLHIGVVARTRARSGRPLVVHNIGRGAQTEDVLDAYQKIGHYRW